MRTLCRPWLVERVETHNEANFQKGSCLINDTDGSIFDLCLFTISFKHFLLSCFCFDKHRGPT